MLIVLISKKKKDEHAQLDVRDPRDEVVKGVKNSKWTSINKTVLLLLLGTIIAVAFVEDSRSNSKLVYFRI